MMYRYMLRVPVLARRLPVQHRLVLPRIAGYQRVQFNSTKSSDASFKVDNPQLMIAFTCKKCDTRSSHTFSRQSYYKGSVLIQCPGCKGRHLIADNLNIFKDEKFNIEDVLRAKGESVATGTEDLAFEDIPHSLQATLGHYAKDAPQQFKKDHHQPPEQDVPGLPTVDGNEERK